MRATPKAAKPNLKALRRSAELASARASATQPAPIGSPAEIRARKLRIDKAEVIGKLYNLEAEPDKDPPHEDP